MRITVLLAVLIAFGVATSRAQTSIPISWSPVLGLPSLHDVPGELAANMAAGQQVELVRGAVSITVASCDSYLQRTAAGFYPRDNAQQGAAAPYIRRCYALTYLRKAKPATRDLIGLKLTSHLQVDELPNFVSGIRDVATSGARRPSDHLSWVVADPSLVVVS